MSTPTSTSYPSTRSGKPINIGDYATVVGIVTAVSGTGPTATVTLTWLGSGNSSANVLAEDVAATTQTL